MMNKHDKLYHLIQNDVCHVPAVAPCDTEVLLDYHNSSSDVVLCDAITSSPLPPDVGLADDVVLENNLNLITYGNCISNTFFDHDKKCTGGGSTFLITPAITEIPVVVSQLIHPRDICYHMKVGKFVNNLTRSQRDDFAHIISETAALASERHADYTNYLLSSIPCTWIFIDNVYVRGKFSLVQSLLHPIPTVIDKHGYVSLQDCVVHLLAMFNGYSKKSKNSSYVPSVVNKITESVAVEGIKQRASLRCGTDDVIALYCTEWSDDFDPSVSIKANRQSCWIKTVMQYA
jgi:hypothetical protein